MAGTSVKTSPVIILVRPQLGENIGMCARAMLNCAVTELRLVAPRDGWPSDEAVRASSGAVEVIDNVKIFETTGGAVADLEYVLATTARGRGMVKEAYTSTEGALKIHEQHSAGKKCGILFGPERAGLENEDVAMADAILHIPLNQGFSSLNLAQAVLLVCHAWLSADNPFPPLPAVAERDEEHSVPATKSEIETLMAHLEDELDKSGFFRSPNQKPTIVRNIRNFFFRSAPTRQEVRTMHGVFSCLTGKKSWK